MIEDMKIPSGLFSADSHVVEPEECYLDNIEKKYRDRAPRFVRNEKGGECFHAEGFTFPIAQLASCGMDLAKAEFEKMALADANRGAFDPKQRLLDQERDGVIGEVIYPSIGMFLCGLEDVDYKQACMWAYNRWLQQFVSHAPDRLVGLGQTAVRSVAETIEDLRKLKEMGFRGVMLPAEPATAEGYHDPSFDALWHTAVELDMPISFHILTARANRKASAALLGQDGKAANSAPKENQIHDILRVNQDIVGLFIWGGVFERHPRLKLVCAEADASWAPHFVAKMDHYYTDRPDMKWDGGLKEPPSYYFKKNVYLTFQDDWITFDLLDYFASGQLLWANDFPHPDGCWPHSQRLLGKHGEKLSAGQKADICGGNVRALYGLN